MGDTSPPPPVTVKAIETPSTVAVLLVPGLGKPLPLGTACAGVGILRHTKVDLRSALGSRSVSDAAYVPRQPLPRTVAR